jgi:hypothetical protein
MSSNPDNFWTESEDDYALVDRKLLIGSHYFSFTDEFNQLVEERLDIDLDNTTDDELRVNQPFIALLVEYGVDKATDVPVQDYYGNPTKQDVYAIDLPAGYTWKVMVDDGYDYDYSMTFVWKEFTMALLNDDEHPLVNAYKEGRLVGVKEGEPRLIEDLTGDDE